MDFSSRGAAQSHQPQQSAHSAVAAPAGSNGAAAGHAPKKRLSGGPKWFKVVTVVLLFFIALLALAVTLSFKYDNPSQSKYVDTSAYQAVFLTNGQVYFGRVKNLNNNFMDLQDIFYLSNQQAQPSNSSASSTSSASNKFSLVKLGCELHGPDDEMVINGTQISFWENLRGNGQVVQAINKWYKENPNGLQCS